MKQHLSVFCVFQWLFPLLALLTACQPDSTSQTASGVATTGPTRASVMQHHDSLMSRMDALNTERQRLQHQLTTLDTTGVAGRDAAPTLRRRTQALVQADAAMMDWMHHYQEPDTTRLSAHQLADFWADQAYQLTQLDRQITTALDSAQQLR
ncbi:hypothetical protein [Hymenobacter sp. GOD-10R]|uniref:hypothetical protein n=1 Tax=Hymenobacter sp. GOD-10R TaxID=3093922 RepID=UPI002D782F90|nr:hypothetical protein [Hymenobacter sp. GOD-10R]WRQ31241.1 hypothetical protein SD425_13320 [Hymenobacter sp. GOD-10R]